MTVVDEMKNNQKKLKAHHQEFYNTFGIHLSVFIWHYAIGFDIVKFDEWLKTPDGISTKQYIQQKYGDKAVELIEKLLA